MKKGEGYTEALKLVKALNANEQVRLLDDLAKKDPELAQSLRDNLILFDDLVHLDAKAMGLILQKTKTDDWGLALRAAQVAVKEKILGLVSSRLRAEIEDVLKGPPRLSSEVQKKQQEILEVVRNLIQTGQMSLRKESSDEWV